jgi:hypothetical protein
VVDSKKVEDIVEDGYVEDIDSDFGFIYYIKISFEGAPEVLHQMKDKTSIVYKEAKKEFRDIKSAMKERKMEAVASAE